MAEQEATVSEKYQKLIVLVAFFAGGFLFWTTREIICHFNTPPAAVEPAPPAKPVRPFRKAELIQSPDVQMPERAKPAQPDKLIGEEAAARSHASGVRKT